MGRPPSVVVVGGGFAGIEAVRALSKANVGAITLVDRHNHHLFQPLLYQVATGGLNPSDIAQPIRKVLRGLPVSVLLGDVQAVDLAARTVTLDGGQSLPYDELVLYPR